MRCVWTDSATRTPFQLPDRQGRRPAAHDVEPSSVASQALEHLGEKRRALLLPRRRVVPRLTFPAPFPSLVVIREVGCSVNELVELPAVQPHTPALGAVVDLD